MAWGGASHGVRSFARAGAGVSSTWPQRSAHTGGHCVAKSMDSLLPPERHL